MSRTLQVIIEGDAINDIASFYNEINRLFMRNEDWQLACSLDALDDMLYGGYGIMLGYDDIKVIWNNIDHSSKALGIATTQKYYQEKLASDFLFNKEYFRERLDKLNAGEGKTYFDIVIEIFESHKNIQLMRG